MSRFGLVCLAGFAGGSVGGFLDLYLPYVLANAPDFSADTIITSAIVGLAVGGPFGIVAFPACYYLFLSGLSLKVCLAVALPVTIIVALLFELSPIYSNNITYDGWTWQLVVRTYGSALAGLFLSSVVLSKVTRRSQKR